MEEDSAYIDPHSLAIYQKGKEIFDLVIQITDLIPDDNKALQESKGFMISDAAQLSVKVAGATNIGLFDIKMEAATIIRKAAKDLKIQNHNLEMHGFKEVQYFDLVRDLIEEYRLLFINWVADFDPWDYIVDDWGLFNPPGIEPDDKDDDMPF